MTTEDTEYGVFPYRMAPDGMLTRRQLRARGLRPNGQQAAGEIRWWRGERVAYLYRPELAAPVRPMTARRQAALDAAMKARKTCKACGREQEYCIPRRYGCCLPCHDAGK